MNKKIEIEREEKLDYVNEEITKVIPIEDSPFTIVKLNDKYFLALGKYRLSDLFDSEEEARKDSDDTSWLRLLSIIHAVSTETTKDIIEQTKKNNNGKDKK